MILKALQAWLLTALVIMSGMAQAQVGSLLRTAYQPPQMRGTVRFYLEDIGQRTGLQFSYSDEVIKRRRIVRLKGSEHTIAEVLQTIFSGTGVTAVERGGKILLIPATGEDAQASQSVTISGIVKDSASREVLIGAIVYVPALNAGTTTNSYGFYSLTLPPGRHEVITSSISYHADTSRISISSDLRRDVLLPYGLNLAGVTVSSQKDAPSDHAHLTMKSLASHAGLLGENDVLRALQYLPGVQSGPDGSSTVLVRGGDPGQNLNLLDGVPLYYIDHFYGITSIFNTDAVKSVDFYKGAFPARYGGRLSSIIDVASRDGNMERFSGQASLGLLKGSLTLEGPIIKDKASVMFSARRTWIDALWRPFLEDQLGIDFYDINTKANCIINKNNRVYASFYTGRDQFRVNFDEKDYRALWGNTIGSARWTSIISPKLFINTTATYSYFRYQTTEQTSTALPDSTGRRPRYTGTSAIHDITLRVQADYFLSPKQHLQIGGQYASADFSPAAVSFVNMPATFSSTSFHSNEIVLYVEEELKMSQHWMLRGGLHTATWLNKSYQYSSLQPRLYIVRKMSYGQSLYASATKMSQFLHLLSSNASVLRTDFWIPSTSHVAPERSWLYAAGYSKKLAKDWDLSTEVYYKNIRNTVSYKGGTTIFENSSRWEEALTQGRGYSYGAEIFSRGKWGPLTASLSYTLSRAWRQFDILNNGAAFPYRYDRRHNLHTELFFERRKRFNAIASWTYMSGEAITLPDQAYPDFDNNLLGVASPAFTYNYSARNNYRLPPIHRLDVAFNFVRRRGRYFERTWTLGLFNAYGQKNVMSVTLQEEAPGAYTLQGLSLFRCIPTISYSVKF